MAPASELAVVLVFPIQLPEDPVMVLAVVTVSGFLPDALLL